MDAKVRDKKTGNERLVSVKAYNLIPHRYDLLGYVDDQGNFTASAPVVVEKKREAVSRAAARSSVTRADLDRMNEEAIARAKKAEEEKTEAVFEFKDMRGQQGITDDRPQVVPNPPVTGPDQEGVFNVEPPLEYIPPVVETEFKGDPKALEKIEEEAAPKPKPKRTPPPPKKKKR